jgi:drug/metabolite transporter (DMT)-like permease
MPVSTLLCQNRVDTLDTEPTGKLTANLAAFTSAVLFGASLVAVRVIVEDVPPTTFAFVRFGIGGLFLMACLLVGWRGLLRVSRGDLPAILLLGGLIFAAFPVIINVSLSLTEASRGALMVATMPIWSAVLARLIGGEHLTRRQIAGIALSFSGVGIVMAERGLNLDGQGRALLGDTIMFLGASTGALYGILAKRMLRRYRPLTVTAWAMIGGATLLIPFVFGELVLFRQTVSVDAQVALLIGFTAIFGGAIGYVLWTFGLSRLSATQTAVYINLNPLVAALLAAALLSERLGPVFVAGFIAVAGGVLMVNWPRRTPAR